MRQAAIALLASALVAAADTRVPPRDDRPGFRPEYVPPAAGSYRLPVIQRVGNHPLLDGRGQPTTLFDLKGQRLAVVAFIYTACTDAGGCPLSQATLLSLDRALGADPELSRQAMLITVSFDPERDTPGRMAVVRSFHAPRSDWRFTTTRSEEDLRPLLADFDQPVAKLRFDDGTWTGLFRHVLKVFLLDERGRVRNVYSVGLLDSALVLNDLRTLLLESDAR